MNPFQKALSWIGSWLESFWFNVISNFWIKDLEKDFRQLDEAAEYYGTVYGKLLHNTHTVIDRYYIRKNSFNYIASCLQSLGYFSFVLISFDGLRGTVFLKPVSYLFMFFLFYNLFKSRPWVPNLVSFAFFFFLLYVYYSLFDYNFYSYYYLMVFYNFCLRSLVREIFHYGFMRFQWAFRGY